MKLTILIPVYDWKYGVIGTWKKLQKEAHKTHKGNYRVEMYGTIYVFSSKTGYCINKIAPRIALDVLSRMGYPTVLPKAILEEQND